MLSQNQGVELSESLVDSNFADDGETDKSDVVPVSADDMDWKARCDEHATYNWDYILVFPYDDPDADKTGMLDGLTSGVADGVGSAMSGLSSVGGSLAGGLGLNGGDEDGESKGEPAEQGMLSRGMSSLGDNVVGGFGALTDAVGLTGEVQEEEPKLDYKGMLDLLHNAGLETYVYFSIQKDEIYIKIRMPYKVLESEAVKRGHMLPLCPERLGAQMQSGMPTHGIKPIFMKGDVPGLYGSTQFVHASYDVDETLKDLYKRSDEVAGVHPFSAVHRLRRIKKLIEGPVYEGGCGVSLAMALQEGVMLAAYPLHHVASANALAANFLVACRAPWRMDLCQFKDYFGEKLGLYMGFLCHYTEYLCYISVPGFAISAHCLYLWDNETTYTSLFGPVAALWCVLLITDWRRKQSVLALTWGVSDFHNQEEDRAEFEGAIMNSPVHGSDIKWYPESARRGAYFTSVAVTFALLLVVLGFLGLVFWMKATPGWVNAATAINPIGIVILNKVYQFLAFKLTENENHQTNTTHTDSLRLKLFIFQFINSYGSLYYIAFAQVKVMDLACDYNGCSNDLTVTLLTVFLANLVTENVVAMVVPKIMAKINMHMEGGGEEPMSVAELQYLMLPYDPVLDTLMQYNTMVLQYGYVVLFIVAFPGAPFIALISNYCLIRTDTHKLLYSYRRADPTEAQDIGMWDRIITAITVAAIITNTALACFLGTLLHDMDLYKRTCGFIIVTYFLFAVLQILQFIVPAEPQEVRVQLDRQEFIRNKFIRKLADPPPIPPRERNESGNTAIKDHDDGPYMMTVEEQFVVGTAQAGEQADGGKNTAALA